MEEQEIHLLDYIHVIANRKWILIASVFCVLTTVIVGTLLTQPLYRADAKLKIGKDKIFSPMIGRRMDYWEPEYSESISFKTHAEMINSFPVMYKAAKALKLDEIKNEDEVDPTFKEIIRTNLAKMKGWFFSLFSIFSRKEDEKTIPYPEDPYTQWAFALKGEVNVSPIRDTRIIVVSVTDSDPVFCRDAANKICESYIKYLAETRLESSKKVLSFFKEELFKMEEKIDESEKKFFNFKQKEKIFSLEGKKNISFKGIGSLNEDLIKTRVGRNDLEERVKELKRVLKKGRIGDFTSGILDNKILFDLKGDLIRTEIELEELKNVYKEKHPKIIQAKIKIRNIKESFKRELRKALDSLNQEISILKGKEDNIKTQLKDIEKKDFSLSERELRYAMLEREVETNRELYDALLTNLKETDVLKEIGEEDIRLIEAAHIPSYPIKPRKTLNIFLGLICGLSLGVGLSFFFDYMDRSIKTEEDVAKY
ncbi:MAG: GumC family protein, partial [Thermodesulfobacteriota bacterium]|nr:GumC family protein [Thermodesulfobacteriota bacterium]